GGCDDLHDVGALRDSLDAARDRFEQRLQLRAREARFAVETLAQPFLRQPAQLCCLTFEPLAETHEGETVRGGKRDGGRRKDGHDQACAERREPPQGLTPGLERRPCWKAGSWPWRSSHNR